MTAPTYTVAFVAPCDRCGQPCQWRATGSDRVGSLPTYRIDCWCQNADGWPTDLDLAEYATCRTCGATITRSASEWFHVDPSEWDRMQCWRNGPTAGPVVVSVAAGAVGGQG